MEGTGLGLAISKTFVELMGGRIRVKSRLNRGAVFEFDIRMQIPENQASVPSGGSDSPDAFGAEALPRIIGLEPDQPCFRILIVDDMPDNRRVLMNLLEPLGFQLREAQDGRKAVGIWQEWHPHLIWMDIRMPVMDGYEAARTIRHLEPGKEDGADPRIPRPVIIAISAGVFEKELEAALANGCNDFLGKPFLKDELFAMMGRHLGVRFIKERRPKRGEPGRVPAEDEKAGKDRNAGKPMPPEQLAAAVAALPGKVRADFLEAAEIADFDGAMKIAEQVREASPSLADELVRQIDGFLFHELARIFTFPRQGTEPSEGERRKEQGNVQGRKTGFAV